MPNFTRLGALGGFRAQKAACDGLVAVTSDCNTVQKL